MPTASRPPPGPGARTLRVAALAGALGWTTACSMLGGGGAPEPGEPVPIELGQWHRDDVDCRSRSRCADAFTLRVDRAGRLRVDVYAPVGPDLPELEVQLRSSGDEVLGEAPAVGRSPQQIRELVAAGEYEIRITGTGREDLLSYELIARLEGGDPAPRPQPARRPPRRRPPPEPPPEPEPEREAPAPPADPPAPILVLEVEREGGEPVSVLIDAGAPMGVEPGMRGRLVDRGRQIGRIEIVDVYDSGSRGRLLGGLAAPITIDTEVVLQGSRPE